MRGEVFRSLIGLAPFELQLAERCVPMTIQARSVEVRKKLAIFWDQGLSGNDHKSKLIRLALLLVVYLWQARCVADVMAQHQRPILASVLRNPLIAVFGIAFILTIFDVEYMWGKLKDKGLYKSVEADWKMEARPRDQYVIDAYVSVYGRDIFVVFRKLRFVFLLLAVVGAVIAVNLR